MFDDAERLLGGQDVLVNNAGIAGPTARIEDISVDDCNRTIAIDLNAMFYRRASSRGAPLSDKVQGRSNVTR